MYNSGAASIGSLATLIFGRKNATNIFNCVSILDSAEGFDRMAKDMANSVNPDQTNRHCLFRSIQTFRFMVGLVIAP